MRAESFRLRESVVRVISSDCMRQRKTEFGLMLTQGYTEEENRGGDDDIVQWIISSLY